MSAFISVLLFGFATAQVYIYFCNYPSDEKLLRYTVLFVWICNLSTTTVVVSGTNILTIGWYGRSDKFGQVPMEEVIGVTTAIIADRAIQSLFTLRIYRLTRSVPILVCLSALTTGCLVGGLLTVYSLVKADYFLFQFQHDNMALLGVTLVFEAITDTCLTVAICLWLRKGKQVATHKTIRKFDRLLLWSIETGTLTSLVILGTALCLFCVKGSYAWVAMWTSVPGVYSNSLLALLNGRIRLSGPTEYISCMPPCHREVASGAPLGDLPSLRSETTTVLRQGDVIVISRSPEFR